MTGSPSPRAGAAATVDYAKLGQTTYQAQVRYSDRHHPSVHHPALPQPQEFPDKDAAKAWVTQQLRRLGVPERGCFYAEVERGCYQDASYDDRGHFSGLHHATWERAERDHYQALAYLIDDGDQVAWAEDEGVAW
jgi:hypothetical protein